MKAKKIVIGCDVKNKPLDSYESYSQYVDYSVVDGVISFPEEIARIYSIKEDKENAASEITRLELPESLKKGEGCFNIYHSCLRACTKLYEGDYFRIDNTILDYIGDEKNLIIPDGIEYINAGCFSGNKLLESVTIPDSLIQIDDKAFELCSNLKRVIFGCDSKLQRIGDNAFDGCNSLEELQIPKTTDSIGRTILGEKGSYEQFALKEKEILKIENDIAILNDIAIDCCSTDVDLVFPEGVRIISDWCCYGFSKSRNYLKHIHLPESVEIIGTGAFAECKQYSDANITFGNNVKSVGLNAFRFKRDIKVGIIAPDHLIEKYGGINKFRNHIGQPDENGLLITGEWLKEVHKHSNIVDIPEGVKYIDHHAIDFYDIENDIDDPYHKFFSGKLEIRFPDTLEGIGINYILNNKNVIYDLPVNYLMQKDSINYDAVASYFSKKNPSDLNTRVYVSLFIYQNSKKLNPFCENKMAQNLDEAVEIAMEYLAEKRPLNDYVRLAELIGGNKSKVSEQTVKKYYDFCKELKKKKATDILLKHFPGLDNTVLETPKEADPVEDYCLDNYDEKTIDAIIKKSVPAITSIIKKHSVKYKDNGNIVPDFVLKCALAPYIDLLSGHSPEASIAESSESLAEKFEKKSFVSFIDQLAQKSIETVKNLKDKPYSWSDSKYKDNLMGLYGRFGGEEIIDKLIDCYNYRGYRDYGVMSDNEEKLNRYIKIGILLNDSEKAVSFSYENGWLMEYAAIREKEIKEYANLEFGENASENEKKIFEAIVLYESCVSKAEEVMDREYNAPTIIEGAATNPNNAESELFFKTLSDFYKNGKHLICYDFFYDEKKIYDYWTDTSIVGDGNVGLCFTMGIIVADYMFGGKTHGEVIYCRDKGEYRGDYSASTRLAIKIAPEIKNWKIYKKKGYSVYEL